MIIIFIDMNNNNNNTNNNNNNNRGYAIPGARNYVPPGDPKP